MLTTILKVDGSTEPFNPTKLNKWVRWAKQGVDGKLNWSKVVSDTLSLIKDEVVSSQELQAKLIQSLKQMKTDTAELMAGKLMASLVKKKIFKNGYPSVKDLHASLVEKGYMVEMGYTVKQYRKIEEMINHDNDLNLRAYQIEKIVADYALKNELTKEVFETPQFVYMRIAMFMAHDETDDEFKMERVRSLYRQYSMNMISAPSPTFFNAATKHRGLASCCMYSANDTQPSITASNLITDTMTAMSAGLGTNLMIRSINDPVRGGRITHQGKLPYYNAQISLARSNIQAGRAASQTQYYSCYDPEVMSIIMAQNPRTPTARQNRHTNFAIMFNSMMLKKAIAGEDIFTFNIYTAPDLHEAFYKADGSFEELYQKYENDVDFQKNYLSAKDIVVAARQQARESPNNYMANIDNINKQTSFLEAIYSSNLCTETVQPHFPYASPEYLYKEEDHQKGEVTICSLHGVVINNIHTDEDYEEAAYNSTYVADKCVKFNYYALPHIGYTAKKRRNVGIGVLGVAVEMAKKKLKWDTLEGLDELDTIFQRHLYYCVKASIRLAKETGICEWSHKCKWKDGWLPIDDRNKNVDKLIPHRDKFPFDELRKEMIALGGIANSGLILMPPTESSSKATGTSPSLYPVAYLDCLKPDGNEELKWVAPHNDDPDYWYHPAYDIGIENMLKCYAVAQKCIDQSISADIYQSRKEVKVLDPRALLREAAVSSMYGIKTIYYTRVETSSGRTTATDEHFEMLQAAKINPSADACAGGFCTL